MSDLPSCSVCDTRIDPYGRDGVRCSRCAEPCPTCGRDVSLCVHPLAERADLDPKELPNGRFQVAA
jgi:hypothetical protein